MKFRCKTHPFLLLFILFFSVSALAAEESSTTLSPVVVTAARSEQPIETAPAHVSVIGPEDIRRSGARNIPDLLKAEAGIRVSDLLGNGKTAKVDLRGFGETAGSNTLVLVDGRRVNAVDLSGTDWLQIPLEQIERIEIVRGTGSVLYGDNASGGVINIITRTAGTGLEARLGSDFGSYGDNRQWTALDAGTETLAMTLSASRRDTDGYRDNGFLDSKDVGASLRFYPAERLSLGLSGSLHEDDYGLPGALSPEALESDREATTRPDDQASTRDRYLRAVSDYDFGAPGVLSLELSVRDRESDSTFASSDFISHSDLQTRSLSPKYSWQGNILGIHHQITTGADLYRSDLDNRSESSFSTSTASVEKDTEGYYVQDRIDLGRSLVATAGFRHERAGYTLSQQDSWLSALQADPDMDENAWSAGLTWLYSDQSSAYVRVNRSFRFPLTDEMVEYDWTGGRILVNEDLSAQTGMHYEAGLRHHLGDALRAQVALFRADIDDEIFYNPLTFANENHPETRHQGIETVLDISLGDHLAVETTYTYTRATFEAAPYEGNDVPAVPRHQGSLRVSVEDIYPGLVLSALLNVVGERYAISDQANALEKVDAYETLDLRASYARNRWSVYAGVNNLFDEEYSDYVVASDSDFNGLPDLKNAYPAPQRNWVAGLEVGF